MTDIEVVPLNKTDFGAREKEVEIEHFKLGDAIQWNNALADSTLNVYQSWEYCSALSKSIDGDIELLKLTLGQSGLLTTFYRRTINGRDIDVVSPYGFGGFSVWGDDWKPCKNRLYDWLASAGIVSAYLVGSPTSDLGASSGRTAYLLDISVSEETLLRNMAASHRTELKKLVADTSLSVTDDHTTIMPVFIQLYRQTLARVGASATYRFSEQTLQDLCLTSNALLLACTVSGKVVASTLMLRCGGHAEYFINATQTDGRHLTRLLIWESIRRLKSLGVSTIHLGGGAEEGDNLEAFKRRLGGTRVVIPAYKSIINSTVYEKLCHAHGYSGSDHSYFPIYWKPSNA